MSLCFDRLLRGATLVGEPEADQAVVVIVTTALIAAAIIEGFELMRADIVEFRTDTVRELLGSNPRTFAEWCARNADAFVCKR